MKFFQHLHQGFFQFFADLRKLAILLLSSKSDISSKRFAGFLSFFVAVFLAFFGYSEGIINSFLIFAASCLGLTVVEKFKNINQTTTSTSTPNQNYDPSQEKG